MTSKEIAKLDVQRKGIPNKVYKDERGVYYKGLRDGRIIKITSEEADIIINNIFNRNFNTVGTNTTTKDNYIYIDNVYGNNVTAEINNPFKAYQDIDYVLSNVVYTNKTIVINPGSYTLNNYITESSFWYFAPGTLITITDTGGFKSEGSSIFVYGYGEFLGSGSSTIFQCLEDNSYIFVSCSSINVSYRGMFIGNNATFATMFVKAFGQITTDSSPDSCAYIEHVGSGTSLVNMHIECDRFVGNNLFYHTLQGSSGDISNMTITAKEIHLTGSGDYYYSGSTSGLSRTTINCPLTYVYGSSPGSGQLILNNTATASGNHIFILNGDILNLVHTGCVIGVDGSNTTHGTYIINGNITTTAVHTKSLITLKQTSNAKIFINGIIDFNPSSSADISIIDASSSGSTCSIILNGSLYNRNNGANSHGIKITHTGFNGKVQLRQGSIIQTTHASSESVNSTGIYNLHSYPGCTANKIINVLLTQLISTIIVNANVTVY